MSHLCTRFVSEICKKSSVYLKGLCVLKHGIVYTIVFNNFKKAQFVDPNFEKKVRLEMVFQLDQIFRLNYHIWAT